MEYFLSNNDIQKVFKNQYLIQQRKDLVISLDLLKECVFCSAGDIITVIYKKYFDLFAFEGICIAVRRKNLVSLDTSLVLRNVLLGIGVEVTLSYFYNRIYDLLLSDYKRKEFLYKRSKLFYIRFKMNKWSRVK